MSWLASHAVLMAIYAILTGAFFALLYRSEPRGRLKLFAAVSSGLLIVGIALAWAMAPFPN